MIRQDRWLISFADLLGLILAVLVLRLSFSTLPPSGSMDALSGVDAIAHADGSVPLRRHTPGFEDADYLANWLDYRLTGSGIDPDPTVQVRGGTVDLMLDAPVAASAPALAQLFGQIDRPLVVVGDARAALRLAAELAAAGLGVPVSVEQDSGAASLMLRWEGGNP